MFGPGNVLSSLWMQAVETFSEKWQITVLNVEWMFLHIPIYM